MQVNWKPKKQHGSSPQNGHRPSKQNGSRANKQNGHKQNGHGPRKQTGIASTNNNATQQTHSGSALKRADLKCPENCGFTGTLSQVLGHWREKHPESYRKPY
jgi:hypothetical protein